MKVMRKMSILVSFLTIAYVLFIIMELYVLITMISYDYKAWKEKKKEKKEEERRRQIEDKFKNRKLTD